MKKAFAAIVVALLVPAIGFSQVVLPPGQQPVYGGATGGFGGYPTQMNYPTNTYPSGTVGGINNGYGTAYPGVNYGTVGGVNYGTTAGNTLYNPYSDPRYSQQYGNRYMNNTMLNAGMSPAIVPALMGAVVGAVLGAHFGFKGILLGGMAGFLVGNAIWQHFTGQSVFDYLFYGPFYNPYTYGGYGAGIGGGYGGVGYGGMSGYGGMTGYGGYGAGYPGYGVGGYMPPAAQMGMNTLTVGGILKGNPASPTTDLEALRKSYFDTVNTYQDALKDGKNADAARTAMESAQAAYQKAIESAATK